MTLVVPYAAGISVDTIARRVAEAMARDLPGLIAWARAHPGRLTLGSAGAATPHQLGTDLFARTAGIEIATVPYSGTAGAAADIVAGRLPGQIYRTVGALSLVRGSPALRAVAGSSASRSPAFPDLPAVAEALPGYEIVSWNGLFAPARTPEAALERLNAALNAAARDPALRGAFEAEGMELVGGSRAGLAAHLDAEIRQWARLAGRGERD